MDLRIWNSTDTSKRIHNGRTVQILEKITKPNKEVDFESLPMLRVQFIGESHKDITHCWPDELRRLDKRRLKDQEIIGVEPLTNDAIQWDADNKQPYVSGEKIYEFDSFSKRECERIGRFYHPAGPGVSAMAADDHKKRKV